MSGGWRIRVFAVLAIAVLAIGCGSAVPTLSPSSAFATAVPPPTASPTIGASTTPVLTHYAEQGFSLDYPSGWRFSPVVSRFSFQGTSGYLGTIGVSQNQICQETPSSITCNYRGYHLPAGNVMVLVSHVGIPMTDPVQFYDRPTDGHRVAVGGMPAVASLDALGADRVVLTWKVARPDAFGNWIQFDADIRGPDQATMRAQVEALIASFRFEPPPIPMPSGDGAADAVAAKAVAALQAIQGGAYACFPDRPGLTKRAEVQTLPGFGAFRKPLPVSCTIALAATDVGLWKMELNATWTAASDRSAGSAHTIQWLLPDGSLSASSGGGGQAPY